MEFFLSSPPTGFGFDAFALRGLLIDLLDQQIRAGSLELHRELIITKEAVGWIFCQNLYQRVTGSLADFRQHLVWGRDGNLDMRRDQFFNRGGFERHMAGQGMIKCAAKAVHVRQESFPFAFDFFRGDIVRSAFGDRCRFGLGLGVARETEIHQLRFIIGIEQNIARLDIPMQKIVFERHVQRRGDFNSNTKALVLAEPLLLFDPGIEAATISQLHDKVALSLQLIEGINV